MPKFHVKDIAEFDEFLRLASGAKMHLIKVKTYTQFVNTHMLTAARPDHAYIYRYMFDEDTIDVVKDIIRIAGFIPGDGEWTDEYVRRIQHLVNT